MLNYLPNLLTKRNKVYSAGLVSRRTTTIGSVDRFCIDKSSSSELSEAINSMFRWYQNAGICYAYLSDVVASPSGGFSDSFARSAWFTRGWTLQELLAPGRVRFYDRHWQDLGTKQSLMHEIQSITNINLDALEGRSVLAVSISERMSWASKRITTRPEDRAYSLFGIFDVSMPMLYGEGDKAFIRLQEEIIKISDDYSIFAWEGILDESPGLLAPSPAHFPSRNEAETKQFVRKRHESYSMTNQGLSIELNLTPWYAMIYLALLDIECVDRTGNRLGLGIFLRSLDEEGQYARIKFDGRDLHTDNHASLVFDEMRPYRKVRVKVRQSIVPDYKADNVKFSRDSLYGFRIRTAEIFAQGSPGHDLFKIHTQGTWDRKNRILELRPGQHGCVGLIDISPQKKKVRIIKLGFDFDFNPVCIIANDDHDEKDRSIWDLARMESKNWRLIEDPNGYLKAKEPARGLLALKETKKIGITHIIEEHQSIRVAIHQTLSSSRGRVWDFMITGYERLPSSPKRCVVSGLSKKLSNRSQPHYPSWPSRTTQDRPFGQLRPSQTSSQKRAYKGRQSSRLSPLTSSGARQRKVFSSGPASHEGLLDQRPLTNSLPVTGPNLTSSHLSDSFDSDASNEARIGHS